MSLIYGYQFHQNIHSDMKLSKLGDVSIIRRGEIITQKESIPGTVKVVSAGQTFSYMHNVWNRKKIQ